MRVRRSVWWQVRGCGSCEASVSDPESFPCDFLGAAAVATVARMRAQRAYSVRGWGGDGGPGLGSVGDVVVGDVPKRTEASGVRSGAGPNRRARSRVRGMGPPARATNPNCCAPEDGAPAAKLMPLGGADWVERQLLPGTVALPKWGRSASQLRCGDSYA
jgi:hypothetical protein